MTEFDLNQIESELGIKLPPVYRQKMSPFPIPTYAGSGDTSGLELWDSAKDLIQLNRELRVETRYQKPWPSHFFALGKDDSGCNQAIDLRDATCRVLWVDRGHVDSVDLDYKLYPTFLDWAGDYLESVRVDLLERGIDQNMTPQQRQAQEELNAQAGCRRFLFWVGGAFLLALLMRGCSALL